MLIWVAGLLGPPFGIGLASAARTSWFTADEWPHLPIGVEDGRQFAGFRDYGGPSSCPEGRNCSTDRHATSGFATRPWPVSLSSFEEFRGQLEVRKLAKSCGSSSRKALSSVLGMQGSYGAMGCVRRLATLHIRFASLFSAAVIVEQAPLTWVATLRWPVLAVRRIGIFAGRRAMRGLRESCGLPAKGWGGVHLMVYKRKKATLRRSAIFL